MSKDKKVMLNDQSVSIEVTRVFGEYGDKKVVLQRTGSFDKKVNSKEVKEIIHNLFDNIQSDLKKFGKKL